MSIIEEVGRRRTFAIISHPDAGKTTLTEKLLLYGGAIHVAGQVSARKRQRAVTSDWMELERERGISITSTVLQFPYNGYTINLLDTPGHQDFGEDTYRTLLAADAAVMLIDAAKGVEPQTKKLFAICRDRKIPLFTFINKMDRPSRDPLELLDELESVLGIGTYPMNWPLGNGETFKGIYDRSTRTLQLFERSAHGATKASMQTADPRDPRLKELVDEATFQAFVDGLDLLEGAGEAFDRDAMLRGEITPVFFGSAVTNFGVQLFLDEFIAMSPPPTGRGTIDPNDERFTGFVFKIQANMDPRHRDRIAFVRVCSGKFERDMIVTHAQTGGKVRLSSSHKLFGQERETIDEAYPGDIVGLVGHSGLGIGDTLTQDPGIVFHEIPRFPPECFAYLHNPNPGKFKQFRKGMDQLLQEGVIQVFHLRNAGQRVPLLAAVGPLQFEVVQYRLEAEYGAPSRLEAAPWEILKWLPHGTAPTQLDSLKLPTGSRVAEGVLRDWDLLRGRFWQVCPKEMVGRLAHALEDPIPAEAAG